MERSHLRIPGEVTTFWLFRNVGDVKDEKAILVQDELMAYLSSQSLALVVSSLGDGRPEIVVYDPHGVVLWFPPCRSNEAQAIDAYLFRGTYSATRWRCDGTNPFIPSNARIRGVITAPRRAGSLQYARCVGDGLLPEGQCTLNTADPETIQHILEILSRMGFVSQGTQAYPLWLYAVQNPLMVLTIFFLLAGVGCVALYWQIYLNSRAREFGIRARHGALPAHLVIENLTRGMPALLAGSITGGVFAGVLVMLIGQVTLMLADLVVLSTAVLLTIVMTAMLWMFLLFLNIRLRYEVNLVG